MRADCYFGQGCKLGGHRAVMPLDAIARAHSDKPLRVGIVGAGFMARGIANQILSYTTGMDLVAIHGRTPDRVMHLLRGAGLDPEDARKRQWDDPFEMLAHANLDAVIDATGAVDFGAQIALSAIKNGVVQVSLNAELDGTVGGLLAHKARAAGVIYSAADGDQPVVQMNLIRWLRSLGMTPLVVGNIKGLHDPYRTPQTQAAFAAEWGQNVHMVTSFADGTKISFEQAIVANAAGLTIAARGMGGAVHRDHVDTLVDAYDIDALRAAGGIVDYVVGAQPAPGVFVLAEQADSSQRHYLNLYKKGKGPLYAFNTAQHLCHFEVPQTVLRAVVLKDVALQCAAQPRVGVITVAKRDLKAGHTLDGLGGFDTFGMCETSAVMLAEDLLPIGVAEGCVLRHDVAMDTPITQADVKKPENRLIDRLLVEQTEMFTP